MTTSTTSGVIDKISSDRHGIFMGGNWYNNKFKEVDAGISPGDTVEISIKDGKFWNTVKSVGSGPVSYSAPTAVASSKKPVQGGFPVAIDHYSRAIIRQNALTNAVNYYGASAGVNPEEIIKVARFFETYTSGDIEAVMSDPEAMSELEAMVKDAS